MDGEMKNLNQIAFQKEHAASVLKKIREYNDYGYGWYSQGTRDYECPFDNLVIEAICRFKNRDYFLMYHFVNQEHCKVVVKFSDFQLEEFLQTSDLNPNEIIRFRTNFLGINKQEDAFFPIFPAMRISVLTRLDEPEPRLKDTVPFSVVSFRKLVERNLSSKTKEEEEQETREHAKKVLFKLDQNLDVGFSLYQQGKRGLEALFSTFAIDAIFYLPLEKNFYLFSITRFDPTRYCVRCSYEKKDEFLGVIDRDLDWIEGFKKNIELESQAKRFGQPVYPPIVFTVKAVLSEPIDWFKETVPFEAINFSPWLLKELGYTNESTLDPI